MMRVDVVKLWTAIQQRLRQDSDKPNAVAARLGFVPQTFTNIKQATTGRYKRPGYQPTAPVLLTVCDWLGRDPRDFQRPAGDQEGS